MSTIATQNANKQVGFTIVELLIVVVVIAILAAISVVAYTGIQQRAALSAMSSDLRDAAQTFELHRAENDTYPAAMPPSVKASGGVVLSTTQTTGEVFCINAYYQNDASLQASWSSKEGLQNGTLCSGATIGSAVGGNVPQAPRNTNLMPGFSNWTLSGAAAYNSSTGELTLGVNGTARSPLVRIDQPRTIRTGGDMYATAASTLNTPQGGYHVSITYYGSDGTTHTQNTDGYTGNGCARPITLNSWLNGVNTCPFSGGPNIVYAAYNFVGSSSGHASSDLRIKNPLLIVVD